ncbi:uncharacterized protein C20orf96 homolog isoform X7 [Tachyglossus aculeatus]|uniref:uncharacterized protein C20orf96 homolog isoform X7 n=1 Tax=Tachyglossus aculeatus TaxID=9261 RepID=UPI0018F5FBD9|nr:uncharacterized protein C20orf96 homolog isoform X7 [Tachyglossus aculeatus]
MEARIGNLGGFRRPRDRGAPGLNPPRPWLSLSLGLEQDPHPSPEPKVPGRPPLPPIHAGHARPGGRTAAAPHHNAGPPAPSGRRTHPKALAGADLDPVRLHEANQILRLMLKARQSSLEEVKGQARVLRKANRALAESTRRTETLLVDHVRELLQQQDLFGTMIATLESSNQMQLHIAKRQLAETEEREKAKMEGPSDRSVRALPFPQKKIRPYEEGLAQKTKANKVLVEQISYFQRELTFGGPLPPGPPRQLVATLEEEVPRLEMEVKTLQSQTPGLLREEIFPDVLLRKPKCEPDTDVCLDFPREERLPF